MGRRTLWIVMPCALIVLLTAACGERNSSAPTGTDPAQELDRVEDDADTTSGASDAQSSIAIDGGSDGRADVSDDDAAVPDDDATAPFVLTEASEMAAAIRAGEVPAALQAFAEELATFSEEELEQLLSRDWVDVPFHEHLGDPLVETFVRFSMTYLDAHPEARELFAASAGEADKDFRHPECVDGTLEIGFAVSALVRAIAGTGVGGAALYAACVSIGPASLGLCASALGFYIGWQMDTVAPQALYLEGKLDALLEICEQECGGNEQACCVVPLGDGCDEDFTCGPDERCIPAPSCNVPGEPCCEGLTEFYCTDGLFCSSSAGGFCYEPCPDPALDCEESIRCEDGVFTTCEEYVDEEGCNRLAEVDLACCTWGGADEFEFCRPDQLYCLDDWGCASVPGLPCDANGDGEFDLCWDEANEETGTCELARGRDVCVGVEETLCFGDGWARFEVCGAEESCAVNFRRPGLGEGPCTDGCALCLGPDEQFCDPNGDGDGFVCPVTWACYVEPPPSSRPPDEVCCSSPGSDDCVTF